MASSRRPASRFDTTEAYIRAAENLGERFGAVFPEPPLSLLGERAKRATNGPSDPIDDKKVSDSVEAAGIDHTCTKAGPLPSATGRPLVQVWR